MNTLNIIRDCLKVRTIGADEGALLESGMSGPITGGTFHIWSARYTDLEQYYPIFSGLISSDEISRASGFKKPGDGQKFILRHGMTRVILGGYIRKDPQKVRFVDRETGRPDLCPKDNVRGIRFSLSRTDDMVCLGISKGPGIGIDIVKNDPHYPFSATAEYLFTPGERRWIEQASPKTQHFRFFRIWSLKEALLKATGSDACLMKNADVSGIMKNGFLDDFYPVSVGNKVMHFFIHESGCGMAHHCSLVTLPRENTRSEN
jgi:4'-phosphopantetheinyl transferase